MTGNDGEKSDNGKNHVDDSKKVDDSGTPDGSGTSTMVNYSKSLPMYPKLKFLKGSIFVVGRNVFSRC
jgi:hypothetical protein